MSLVHWWPLNGDLQDKIGANDLVNDTTSTQVNNNGKFGKCYKCTSNTAGTLVSTNTINLGRHQSMFCWIYMDSVFTSSNLNAIMGQHRYQYPCGLGLTIRAASDTTGYISINTGSTASGTNSSSTNGGYRTYNVYRGDTLLQTGKWYHLGFVYDNGTIRLYVNGDRENLYNANTNLETTEYTDNHLKNMNIFEDYFGAFMWSFANKTVGNTATHANYIAKGSLCDIRLYDHALSDAEIKELSKALVVHYTFNDPYIEPTTNLLPSSYQKGQFISGASNNNYNSAGSFSATVTTHGTYTLSGYYKISPTDTATNPRISLNAKYAENSNATTISQFRPIIRDGEWHYFTLTGTTDLTKTLQSLSGWFFDYSTGGNGRECYVRDAQLEYKNHATPYTPISRDNMLVNEAGYGGNGTLYNSSLSTDTASGILSCHTPRILSNNTNAMVSTTNSAYVYADIFGYNYTPTEFTVAWWWKVMSWGNGTGPFGLVISNGNYMDSTLGVHDGAVYVNFAGGSTRVSRRFTGGGTGKWTHFAITFKPGSYTSYIDGVSQGTATTDASLNLDPWRYIYLGAGCAGGVLRDGDIYWGDFRYYNTCLSADDISELHKTKAYITDKGDMETHQFIEDCNNLQVTNNHCVEARDIQEIGNEEYEQLEYIASTGTQYIDTGVYWTSETATIVADLMVTAWKASSTIFGSEERYSGSSRYFAHILHAGSANGNYATYIGTGSIGTATLTKDTRSLVEYIAHDDKKVTVGVTANGKKTIYVNNKAYSGTILTHQNSTQTAANRGHIYIFSNHNAYNGTDGIQKMASMKLYRFTMIQDDIYIRDFIPCRRKTDNKVGLFDLVTGQFYTSPIGDFVAGDAITDEEIAVKFLSGGSVQARQFIEL